MEADWHQDRTSTHSLSIKFDKHLKWKARGRLGWVCSEVAWLTCVGSEEREGISENVTHENVSRMGRY